MKSVATILRRNGFSVGRSAATTHADLPQKARDAKRQRILIPGRNAWRIEKSLRSAFLIDTDAYFRRLEQALRTASRSIWILAWDFDGRIRLHPDRADLGSTFGEFLRSLVEKRPTLEIRILIWSISPIYSGRSIRLFRPGQWAKHPRIHMRYDRKHPLRGSHHQKVVCIDDSIAFAGGIDLTAKRWDTCDHNVDSAARVTPDGQSYKPVHDVQMVVEGDAARALGDLARARWRIATGEDIPAGPEFRSRWPQGLKPDLVDSEIAIARTQSKAGGRRTRREVHQLNRDALINARRHIYAETQYFASPAIADILEERLRERKGPDVVILVTRSARGMLERFVMGSNRDRLIRRLKRADRYNRLRVMYPVVPYENGDDCEVLVHSKVLVVDDRFLRIGSSNFNNRSEGLDSECDLAVEARTEAERLAISRLRDGLIAEHLETSPESVRSMLESEGSLVRVIDRLNTSGRGLRSIPVDIGDGATAQLPGTGLLDPKRPYWPLQKAARYVSYLIRKLSGGLV